MHQNRHSRAFTLVELLVVTGIIALLIGLLLPALSAASEQAKTVQCLSNLRQLVIAANIYCNQYDGRYPISTYGSLNGSVSTNYNWDFTTSIDLVSGAITTTSGLLWMGASSAGVQQCPSFDGKSNTRNDPFTGYNYNLSYLGGQKYNALIYAPIKATQVTRSGQCVIFGDGQTGTGADKYMRSPFPGPNDEAIEAAAGTQGFRHRGKTNAAFCDGHAETLHDRFTQTADMSPIAPGTGFLSADNSMYSPQ